ncbi:TM2 domain protein [Halomonas elongata]|uniref:TM2 domain protein n=1 Tax=Halomonas elongata TaxID=2746 RepID=A0A1B8NVS9_HALEL|nr:TM2 domain protein [Halomonas elongata]
MDHTNISSEGTHSKLIGYLLWLFGFLGAHRFYYGKPVTGTIWFFTFGLLGIGWLIDLFLIPSMDRQADLRFQAGPINYSLAWLLLTFLGALGFTASIRASGSPASSISVPWGCSALVCCTISGRSTTRSPCAIPNGASSTAEAWQCSSTPSSGPFW